MTFVGKTGMGVKSPSFTPHTEKSLQSERNEDSAPQHLTADVAAQGGAGEATETPIEAVRVPLPGGLFAIVDAADAERVLARRWHTKRQPSRPSYIYAQHSVRVTPGRAGKKSSVSLHRFVMGCEPGDPRIVDHKNGQPLDCRRENLRFTDHRGNATNVTSSKNSKAGGYKGVTWNKAAGKWQASICAGEIKANGKRRQLYLGVFTDPVSAAHAYDNAAVKHFGEFASLNFDSAWFGPKPPVDVAADFQFLQADLGGVAR